MRLIFIRHGESQNNLLHRISEDLYHKHRSFEPELSEVGIDDCQNAGKAMLKAGITFDVLLTSAHKRALLSAKHILESYPEVPVQLMLKVHEHGGVYMQGKTYPGLNMTQAKEILPQLQIPDSEAAIFGDEHSGWFKQDAPETIQESLLRVKESVRGFKQLAKNELRDKTVLIVTHGQYLHYLTCILLGQCDQATVESDFYLPFNNSLTIVDFDVHETPTQEVGYEERAEGRLVAHNLHILANEPTSSKTDF